MNDEDASKPKLAVVPKEELDEEVSEFQKAAARSPGRERSERGRHRVDRCQQDPRQERILSHAWEVSCRGSDCRCRGRDGTTVFSP
jgi:hypothetical protein